MTRYRVGGHWGVTIIEVGTGPETGDGRREGDRLIAVAQTREDAELIVLALNAVNRYGGATSQRGGSRD